MQNPGFVYFSSKSGKHMKQMSNPPFWGDVGVKKWSSFLDSGARSPVFGHLKMGTIGMLFLLLDQQQSFFCPHPEMFIAFGNEYLTDHSDYPAVLWAAVP